MIGLTDFVSIEWNWKIINKARRKKIKKNKNKIFRGPFLILQLSNVKKGSFDLSHDSIPFQQAIMKVGNCKDTCSHMRTQRYSLIHIFGVFSSFFQETLLISKNVTCHH